MQNKKAAMVTGADNGLVDYLVGAFTQTYPETLLEAPQTIRQP